jgi:hypothetical protein
MKEFLFRITGGFDVDEELEPMYAANGSVCGFRTASGAEVRLIVGLELKKDDSHYEDYTSDARMRGLGFSNLDYGECTLEEMP